MQLLLLLLHQGLCILLPWLLLPQILLLLLLLLLYLLHWRELLLLPLPRHG